MTVRRPTPLEVRNSGVHGRGVFATADIPPGAFIGRYTGRRYSAEQAAAREWNAALTYVFGLSDGSLIDGASGGNATRHMNHSCEPNCQAYEMQANNGGLWVQIETRILVATGSELSIDYALATDAGRPEDFKCRCATPSCRGTMLAVEIKARQSRQ